jgi:UDP-N-acetyl-D-mannosaminuronic acid dehydrogenase
MNHLNALSNRVEYSGVEVTVIEASGAFQDRNVCIVGLGYVGLTLAAVMTSVGFRVTGIEIREEVLEGLRNNKSHFHEPGLEQMLVRATSEGSVEWHHEIPENCDASVYIITVGTPLGQDGRVHMDTIERVTREIAACAKPGSLVIMRSTVMVGTTTNLVLPILRAANKNLSVAFCPERTVEGQALSELRQLPQIVGVPDLNTAIRATQIFQFLTSTVVRVSNYETAEMIKLIDNSQRDVLFAFANEVASLCDALGISADEVIRSGKLGYARHLVPLPGPVGGPCLSKDTYILAEGLAKFGGVPEIALTSRRTNERQLDNVGETLRRWTAEFPGFAKTPIISLLGLAFKGRPATDDLRGTTAKQVLAGLRKAFPGAQFRGYDAVCAPKQIAEFGVEPAETLEAAFTGASLVVILNNHPVFENMPLSQLAALMQGPGFVYDLWHNFKERELSLPASIGYASIGSHGLARFPAVAARLSVREKAV